MLLLMKKDQSRKMDSSGGGGGGRHIRTHLLVDMDRAHRNSDSCDNRYNGGGESSSSTSSNYHSLYNDNHCDGIWDPCSSASGGGGGGGDGGFGGGVGGSRRGDSTRRSTKSADNNNGGSAGRRQPPFIQISGPKMQDNGSSNGGGGGSGGHSPPYGFRKSGSLSPSSVGGSFAGVGSEQGTGELCRPVSGRHGGRLSPSPSLQKSASMGLPKSASGAGGRRSPQPVKTDSRIKQVLEDCFIIPASRVGTFLPIAFQQFDSDQNLGALSMLQVEDPKLYIVLHFAEPCSSALTLQLTALRSSLYRVRNAGIATEGMLLMNMERNSAYPFIVYVVVNTAQTPPGSFLQSYNSIIMDELTPDKLNNSIGSNYISGYEEVATIVRPPIDMGPKTPSSPKTAYLITIFKVFPGEDREKLERSWLLWTGARMIYKHLPQCLGLRRITFHKKLWADGGITYMLLCECSTLLDHVTIACGFVEHIRARCCGYTALYKCTDKF